MKIVLESVEKKFKNQVILSNLNLEFESGNIYCLYGPNGSGKSVLLKIITHLYSIDNGKIKFDDVEYNKNNICCVNMRALIETPCFFPDATGFENLKILAKIKNLITDDIIIELCKKFNLYKDINKKYKTYSLGMKQKLGIIQVLMEDPDIIILDEPFNALDNKSKSVLKEILISKKKENKLIIFSSHIKDEIKDISDFILKFDNERLYIKKVKLNEKSNINTK